MFTDSVIAAQVFTFITMGSEAISNTISFTLYELANNPGVQSRLQKEIDTVLLTQEITYNNLKKMTYMDQVINGFVFFSLILLFFNCSIYLFISVNSNK